MKIGISSWACPWQIGVAGYPVLQQPMDWRGLLSLARQEGAQVLQIADNLPLHTLPSSEWDALGQGAAAHGITLEVGTRGLQPDRLRTYLRVAQHTQAKLVRTLPHDGADRPSQAEAQKRLRAVLPLYEQANIALAIENHDFYPASWLRELVDALDSPFVRACLDAINNLGQGESFREVLSVLGPVTASFHCKDYVIRRKPTQLGFDVEGCPAGEGFLDLKLARQVLPQDCTWVIESWLPWQGDIDATCQMERDWVHIGMNNLRAFRDKTL